MATNDQIIRAARAIDSKADLSVSGGDVNTIVWENVFSGINIDTLKTKITAIEAEDTANSYQLARQRAYPSLKEQLDLQYWDQVNGTTKWKDAIAKIKSDNPKP